MRRPTSGAVLGFDGGRFSLSVSLGISRGLKLWVQALEGATTARAWSSERCAPSSIT